MFILILSCIADAKIRKSREQNKRFSIFFMPSVSIFAISIAKIRKKPKAKKLSALFFMHL